MKRTLLLLMLSLSVASGIACSCFGPQTFCGTLDPPYEEPQWWIPDAIVLGVKLAQSDHGMDVEVVGSIAGAPQVGDTLRVWGDCGLLCRIYPGAWEVGDTVVWALQYTDLAGNGACGTSLEQQGDYMISVCGVYSLSYDNGMVSGPIDQGVPQLPYEDFLQYIITCGATGLMEEQRVVEVEAILNGGSLNIRTKGFEGEIDHQLIDAQGAILAKGTFRADQVEIPVGGFATGVYLVQVTDGDRRRTLRIFLP